MLHLPLSLILTSLSPLYVPPLSDFIPPSRLPFHHPGLLLETIEYFLPFQHFVFLPVLPKTSVSQALINSCFALSQFLLSALEGFHTDCLYQHCLSILLKHFTPHVNLPDSHWHLRIRWSFLPFSLKFHTVSLLPTSLLLFCFDPCSIWTLRGYPHGQYTLLHLICLKGFQDSCSQISFCSWTHIFNKKSGIPAC